MKRVHTLADLASREVLDAGAAKPARLAVLGYPVAHSASPPMHQAALDALGIDARYIRLEAAPDELHEVVRRLAELDFVGANVTVPHKFAVMEDCSSVDADALAFGAVNTLRFEGGRIHGSNTDAPGFRCAVEDALGRPLDGMDVLIVGAGGGAGQALAMTCAMAGVRRLVLVNRTLDKLHALETRIRSHLGHPLEIAMVGMEDPALPALARPCGVIVQTSSLGLRPGDAPVLGPDCLVAGQLVYDTIYQPPVTPLLALARERGCRTANGESMLLHQGALAFRIWFPLTDPLEWMRKGLAGGRDDPALVAERACAPAHPLPAAAGSCSPVPSSVSGIRKSL